MAEKTLSCANLVDMLSALPRNITYTYVNPVTHTVIKIEDVQAPYGPITIRRWDPTKGETESDAGTQTISKEMLFRISNAVEDGMPINVDRVLGASYNTRSALEALICHTPQFYYCYPGRIENKNGATTIKPGHKHIIWLPDEPHAPNTLTEKKLEHLEINEIPTKNVVYNALEIPGYQRPTNRVDATNERMHHIMQMALYEIGLSFGLETFIAKNDSSMKYKGKPLYDHEGIVRDLSEKPTIAAFDGAVHAGSLIDAIWLSKREIPAIFEVEHSTGVTSGLTRMKGFMDALPPYQGMRFIIVADDSLRDKVVQEINRPQFRDLHAYFFPYSAVNELLFLCQNRKLKGISNAFIETFLEDVLEEPEE